MNRAAKRKAKIESLTAREAEVLSWVARGKSNADIGYTVGCSTAMVKKHLQRVFDKLNV
jgi:DNA-binding CsgD family transcriptional regulator